MKFQFRLRCVPEGLKSIFAEEAGNGLVSATLKHLAIAGMGEHRNGKDIRFQIFRLCGNTGMAGSFGVAIPDDSPLAHTVGELDAELKIGRGNVFLLLAIIGFEKHHAQATTAHHGHSRPPPVADPQPPVPLSLTTAQATSAPALAPVNQLQLVQTGEGKSDRVDDETMAAIAAHLMSQFEF